MRILDRYCVKECMRYLMGSIMVFVSLYVIIELFGKARMFMSNHATLSQIVLFFTFSIPKILWQVLPLSVLVATLLTFGTLSRNKEITALKSCGISLYRTAIPIISIALFCSFVIFLLGEYLVPLANSEAEKIRLVEILKQQLPGSFKNNQIWYRGKVGIYNIKAFDTRTNVLYGVTLYFLDKKTRLIERVDAERGEWKDGQWTFRGVISTSFPLEGFPRLESSTQKRITLPEMPEDFTAIQKNTEAMGFWELKNYVIELEDEGYDATPYRVDMHAKVAFPLVTIIMAMIGMGSSIRWERRSGLSQGVAMGVGIGFSYWIMFAFSLSLGHGTHIPPLLAAWMANIIFGLTAVLLIHSIRT